MTRRMVALSAVALIVVGASAMLRLRGTSDGIAAFTTSFDGPDGLITHERTEPSDSWEVTSGSLFARDGLGWTGEPNRGRPDGRPDGTTNSAVFRMRSTETGFQDVDLRLRFRLLELIDESWAGSEPYDGLHLLLRYEDPEDFYAVSVLRRDGGPVIKRKQASDYTTIAEGEPIALDQAWHDVRTTVRDTDDGAHIRLWLDGELVLDAVDDGGPAPLGGRVGIRADNAELLFDDIRVAEA